MKMIILFSMGLSFGAQCTNVDRIYRCLIQVFSSAHFAELTRSQNLLIIRNYWYEMPGRISARCFLLRSNLKFAFTVLGMPCAAQKFSLIFSLMGLKLGGIHWYKLKSRRRGIHCSATLSGIYWTWMTPGLTDSNPGVTSIRSQQSGYFKRKA